MQLPTYSKYTTLALCDPAQRRRRQREVREHCMYYICERRSSLLYQSLHRCWVTSAVRMFH